MQFDAAFCLCAAFCLLLCHTLLQKWPVVNTVEHKSVQCQCSVLLHESFRSFHTSRADSLSPQAALVASGYASHFCAPWPTAGSPSRTTLRQLACQGPPTPAATPWCWTSSSPSPSRRAGGHYWRASLQRHHRHWLPNSPCIHTTSTQTLPCPTAA